MNYYKTNSELKAIAREKLAGKYGSCILLFIAYILSVMVISFAFQLVELIVASCVKLLFGGLASIITGVISYLVSLLISIFIGILDIGAALFFLKLCCKKTTSTYDLFYGLNWDFKKAFQLSAVLNVINFLCMLPSNIVGELNPNKAMSIYPVAAVLNKYSYLEAVLFFVGLILYLIIFTSFSQIYYLAFDFPQYSVIEIIHLSNQKMRGSRIRYIKLILSFIPIYILGALSLFVGFIWIIPYQHAARCEFFLDLMSPETISNQV